MSVFTSNIPQPGDNPSFSQDQILQNFQTLNTVYGTNGDHYPWTDTNSTEATFHAKVTMPGLPTSSAPGNVLPTPAAGRDAIFSQTRNSQTTPFLVRDGLVPTAPLTNIWPLMPIKAYINFTLVGGAGNATINDSYNITGPAVVSSDGGGFGKTTIQITNAMRTTTYGVIALSTGSNNFMYYLVTDTTHFVVRGLLLTSGATVTAFAIES